VTRGRRTFCADALGGISPAGGFKAHQSTLDFI
jgi:hypothetical protein